MAAEAGAKMVYAIEVNPEAAAAARELVRSKGLEGVVIILAGGALNLTHQLHPMVYPQVIAPRWSSRSPWMS